MAGGIGSRFWPVSRNSKPKQFLDILGTGRTFLQMTFDRFSRIVPEENILVVTSEAYKELVMGQLPSVKEENVLLEPYRRNTAPCIAYAMYKLAEKCPDATVVVAPSDHMIANEDIFEDTICGAFDYAAANDSLLTLGISPTRPETGYGYIQCNMGKFKIINGHTAYSVKTFTEKPDKELAKVLVESGEFLWNSGIFVWNLKAVIKEFELHLPDMAKLFGGISGHYNTPDEKKYIDDVYSACQSISIDYGIMEKTGNAWVFKASFGWSDLGTWDSLYSYSQKDDNGNMISGQVVGYGVKDSAIVSVKGNKLVVVKGLENFMVVDTDDVLMICPRNAKDFKNLITDLSMTPEAGKYQ